MTVELLPRSNADSAQITRTDERAVIDGSYSRISNGYFYRRKGVVSIEATDILFIAREKHRRKRLLVAGLVLFGFVLMTYGLAGAMGQFFLFNDLAEGDFSRINPSVLLKNAIYAGLLLVSTIILCGYAFKPVSILRIKAMGGDFAVEVKHYHSDDVDQFIKAYYL